jgi:hypothetical protein
MRRYSVLFGLIAGVALTLTVGTSACSGNNGGSGFGNPGGNGNNGNGNGNGDNDGGDFGDVSSVGSFGDVSSGPTGEGGVACPPGLQCNVSCPNGGTTTISGKVYDPAGKDPLYNIAVYVPAVPLVALPRGVPTGAQACSCEALYPSGAVVNTATAVDGTFKLTNAPVGTNVPLVLQVGKWRRLVHVNTTACTDNAQPDKSLALPHTVAAGDTDDNIPDIAVSTGGADQLECLLTRVGLDAAEYVPGWSQSGHVHIFNGGSAGILGSGGHQEKQLMPGAPNSYDPGGLWDSLPDLMKNDIVLLSCEGSETYNNNSSLLEQYLNAGGRAFASHFHYAWFNTQPADWGSNLATWTTGGGGGGMTNTTIGGTITTTLTGGGTFAKGVALQQWLGMNGALGQMGVPPTELAVAQPRFNAAVTTQKPSQSWIEADPNAGAGGAPTLYFSFDTPVNAPAAPDGGAPNYCGRAVFSGLHVGGASYDSVNCSSGGGGGGGAGSCPTGHIAVAPPPAGCDTGHDLSPQEKALEFMLFDLSSCVLPDYIPPPDGGTVIR